MPTNQSVPVATGSGANVRTYSQWAGTAVQVTGIQTGIVASKDMNTAWRQGTTMASVLGQMIVNRVGIDATDDGNVAGLLANIERGIAAMLDAARYGEDSGAVNTLVATVTPAPVALTPFLTVYVRVQFANTSVSPTLNINGFGPRTIVRQDGGALAAGDLVANRITPFVFDRVANVWRVSGAVASDTANTIQPYIRTRLTAPLTLNVATTGSDTTGTGASGAPFATIQKAIAQALTYDCAGNVITIKVADGTYPGPGAIASSPLIGSPNYLNITGNPTNPGNCLISNTQASGNISAFTATQGGTLNISGFTVQSSFGHGLFAQGAGSVIQYQNMVFTSCLNGSHVRGELGGECIIGAAGAMVYTIGGGAQAHFSTSQGGTIINNNGAVTTGITLAGTPAFSIAFASPIGCSSMSLPGLSFSGSASGLRYSVGAVSSLNTNGGGANYFPGTTAGAVNGNGFYG